MSEDIVNRMKAEGQLIRNTGKHSIRSVKIQLDRFEGIFETISDHIQMQTQFLADAASVSAEQLRIDQETRERERARQQREDLVADQESTTETKSDTAVKKKEREGIFSLIKGIGITKLLLGGAAIAGVGFAAYNILKGFIDEKTGGKFSDFEEGLIDTIKNIDFESIKNSFNTMKEKFLSIAENIEKIALFLENPFENLKLADIFKTITFGAIATKIIKAKGIPLPLKFGALAVAAALFGAGGGGAEIPPEAAIEERPEVERRAREAAINEGPEAAAEIYKEYQEKYPRAIPPGGIFKSQVQQEYWEDWLKSPEGMEYRNRGMKGRISDLDSQFEADRLGASPSTSVGGGVWPPVGQEELIIAKRKELVNRRNQIDEMLQKIEDPVDFKIPEDKMGEYEELIRELKDINKKLRDAPDIDIKFNSFQKGTKGFQDFGPASFAILHGKEAVVPEETPAGRFLDQFFTENWEPKMSSASNLAERVSTVANGNINIPIIVNNSPTVAPVVNNVQGGPSITNTNLFGGSSSNKYGLTNSIN